MRVSQIVLLPQYEEKLLRKHGVSAFEVEEVLFSRPHFRLLERGNRPDEDLYSAYGQTVAGRYLIIFFVLKLDRSALVVSGRDMDDSERKYYGKRR